MPRTVLDVTRLLTRAAHPVATGVDRVELAYARRVLALPPERAGFAVVVGKTTAPLPRAAVAAFVGAVERRWSKGAGNAAAAGKLAARLGAPELPAGAASPAKDEAARLALRLRGRAVLNLRAPAVAAGDIYVHVSHIRLDRPEPFAALRAAGADLVTLVHDLIPVRFPEYGRDGEDRRHRARMTTILDHATAVIANSADTARDFLAFADENGRAAPPVIPAPLGVESGFDRTAAPLQAGTPYFLMLGTIEPRKNHLTLLHVWRRLAERLGAETPTLVLAGRRGWENEMVIDLLERAPAIRAHVVEVNDLPDDALSSLMRGARALLFPSFSEGFGLPLAEALGVGAPAIASDLAVFREVAGEAADYLDPLDGPGWERAVLDCIAPASPRRAAALDRAARYAPPDWAAHFGIVDPAIGAA
ncbi:capsular polysaccharide glycosyltransferase biosynthesis protein [Methylopila jiangsuensis]|uniref:Capsular polysaccharide glycosyltransferase biosynthesis protein n=1 Tax=Methylopila jiangsuensis TaxID=586230 RepID=A0A9W6JHJ4_9HYPH|nr:glycosyltransferase family 1 protein [Methylopila jiangsuensis]MDR6284864.1 glycosyltransferase involved in cell wall biosynthesis [Methylopila jiangsuensis]GLK77745.1 capsular polysaccharide glycosyltransferase biosynthesis protein [Methylopila jiangsuensis]